ncbi:hypothetical protein T492DRAFT_380615 [Pavlovales sp. CCMP2436]|nr:hypothetical protein T492DRAFT_380615 [Pavlovales sp. CCMP2436]
MHTHRYVTNPVPAFFMTKETTPIICSAMVEHLLERTFDRVLPILAVTDTVSCLLEKVCLASAKDARIREQKAEVKARERKRDREDAVLEPGRRGSASRKRYTAHEKSVHLENFDKIVADAKVLNKGAEFESTYGIAASTISKWVGDTTRAAIAAGALGQVYAHQYQASLGSWYCKEGSGKDYLRRTRGRWGHDTRGRRQIWQRRWQL